MKKIIFSKKSFALFSMLLMISVSYAQTTSSAYFLEGFSKRYQLNPAFAPERGTLISIPVLGNLQIDAQSSVGLSNFLYDSKSYPGKLTTFMSPDISRDEFLDNLPSAARFNLGLDMDILSLGFGSTRGYTIFNMKIRNNETLSVPKELFDFMKASLSQGNYMIEDINLRSITYMESSLSHSHRINDNLRIGAALKFIEGLAYADLNIDQIDAQLSEDSWKVRTNGKLRASISGAEYKYDSENNSLDGIDFDEDNFDIPLNFGFAIDLGAEYDMKDFVEGLKLSAAITDIGFVKWNNTGVFETDNSDYVEFKGFEGYDVYDSDKDGTFDSLEEDFKDMIRLYQTKSEGEESIGLNATFRAGAEYTLPMAKWLSVGELFTVRTGVWPYVESLTSVTMSPSGWFDFTGSMGFSSYGSSLGMLLNFHPAGFNFFFAVDRLSVRLNPQFVPVNNFGVNVSLGMNLVIGKKQN